MTELNKNFDHQQSEAKWYQLWLDKKYFASKPDHREPYTIVMPPPNVTGILHMGHCLNNTIQDILIRRARMHGKNACWVPGTDHASIATEAKVVQMLRERGITKSSLSRDEFLGYAWEWKEKYGGIILEQLKKLGCSLDWDRTTFTMDPDYYQSVIKVFMDLYKKGFIYRGKRMINWDPKAKTALSDEEVIFKETNSKLYFLSYEIVDGGGQLADGKEANSANHQPKITITIATVRPETILGDTAIAVNPNDERFKHLHGKFAIVPLIGRRIPIIVDEYVAIDFGTGALKVTPAHDANDYALAEKHNLEIIDIMNDDGTFNEAAQLFIGEDRFEVRKKIIPELEAAGNLVKIEDYVNQVGFSERSDAVVEKKLSLQWWLAMKNLSDPALKVVMEEAIQFVPEKFKNLYRHWMENIRDWCISRQLWWGQRIPAWYAPDGSFVVAATKEEAFFEFERQWAINKPKSALNTDNQQFTIYDIFQDEDCLDTWFSSWLWPSEVFKGISHPGNEEINYYYPTNTLVTAPEIIFFWVARMVMAGMEYEKQIPFKQVYFTGIVRDKQGRKMSKSLGNSPDLLALIDQYGADATRFGIMIASPAGNDLLWEESSNEQGRNFCNKIWNALKLLKMWEARSVMADDGGQKADKTANHLLPTANHFATDWFAQRLQQAGAEIDKLMAEFSLSEALKKIYSLVWDDFCSWYLEWVKPGFEQPIDPEIYQQTVVFFTELMQLLHPYMPFITEEIYHLLAERTDDLCVRKSVANSQWSIGNSETSDILAQGELLKKLITTLREARVKNNIKPKETVQLFIQSSAPERFTALHSILAKQVNASAIEIGTPTVPAITVAIEQDKFYIISSQPIDTTAQKETLLKDLEYQQGFLSSVMKKLGNERFVQNAKPDVVAAEEKKKADAEARIKTIEESLVGLS